MTTQPKLESYLAALDKALGPISVSERAEIITEIKSHVLEAQEREPAQNLDVILNSLGEPEQVANKYLLERGLKPGRPAKRPVIKWLVVGFLGALFLMLAFVLVIIFRVSPLVKIDDAQDRVVLLGGLIDVNGKTGSIKVGSTQFSESSKTIRGSKVIDQAGSKQIKIPFTNGNFELTNAADDRLSWECKVEANTPETSFITEENHEVSFNLGSTAGSKCVMKIPAKVSVEMTGNNAKVVVDKPKYNLTFKAQNGKIGLSPAPNQEYTFDIKVINGKIDAFESSKNKDALKINISLTNGVISRD